VHTIDQILKAAAKLGPEQLMRLREELDRLEVTQWEAELASTTAELKKKKITDKDLDQIVIRKRRESRS